MKVLTIAEPGVIHLVGLKSTLNPVSCCGSDSPYIIVIMVKLAGNRTF